MDDVIQMNETTWQIEDGMVRMFLLTGTKEALLIDSGMNTPNAKEIAESITTLPIKLLNTHADGDHISGNEAFGSFYMHPQEEENYRFRGKKGTIIPVKQGDVLDLGGRPLEIIELPGHTKGSIAILDRKNRVLIGGDSIQDGRIFMFGAQRNLPKYIESLEKLYLTYQGTFDVVYPSHGTILVEPSMIPKLIDGAKKILAGEAEGNEVELFGGTKVLLYQFEFAGFLCPLN